jgi:hypothetical protein
LIRESRSILVRWRKYFSQLLNVHGINDARQTEKHTSVTIVPEASVFEVELTIEMLISQKSSGIDQMPAYLIEAGGRTICYEIHKLIVSTWNKEKLPEE